MFTMYLCKLLLQLLPATLAHTPQLIVNHNSYSSCLKCSEKKAKGRSCCRLPACVMNGKIIPLVNQLILQWLNI